MSLSQPRRLLMAAACALAGSAGSPDALAAPGHWPLPIAMHEGYPRLEVQLPGRAEPLAMVLDTAASHTVLDLALAQRLALVDEGAAQARVEGAAGRAAQMRQGRRITLRIGGLAHETAPVLLDLSPVQTATRPVDGILGQDLLLRHDMRLDLAAGRLELATPGSRPQWFAGASCLDNTPRAERPPQAGGFFFADLELRGLDAASPAARVRAVIDTGASQTLINHAARRALGVADDDARLRQRPGGTQGVSAKSAATQLLPIGGLLLAGWQAPPLEVRVSDLPVFDVLGLAGRPAMILGIDVLQQVPLALAAGATRMCLG